MVSRDDRRAVALATRRSRGRVVVRRSVEQVEPAEQVEPVTTEVEKAHSSRPVRARVRHPVPNRKPRLRKQTATPRGRWAVRLLTVALLGALAAAGVLGRQWYDQRQLDTARQQALAAARQESVDFVSISAATIDQDLKRIADGATGQFHDEFTQDMAQVRAAVVLVALDATVKNTNAPDGRLSHYRIQVSLTRDAGSGRWLVSQLQFVG